MTDDAVRQHQAADHLPLPADCLPEPSILERVLRGLALDANGRVVGGLWDGMTVAQVLRRRDGYDRAASDWLLGLLRGE